MLSLHIDGEWIEIKFEVETKFKMAAIVNLVGWRHKSRDSTPCNWNTWRYWLFCCYFRHGRRINSAYQITECLLFFRISSGPPKRLLDQYIFGHTHHWSHSQSGGTVAVPVGRTYNYYYYYYYYYYIVASTGSPTSSSIAVKHSGTNRRIRCSTSWKKTTTKKKKTKTKKKKKQPLWPCRHKSQLP